MLNKKCPKKLKKPIDICQKVWYSIFKENKRDQVKAPGPADGGIGSNRS
jgi:hypothetical protein